MRNYRRFNMNLADHSDHNLWLDNPVTLSSWHSRSSGSGNWNVSLAPCGDYLLYEIMVSTDFPRQKEKGNGDYAMMTMEHPGVRFVFSSLTERIKMNHNNRNMVHISVSMHIHIHLDTDILTLSHVVLSRL